MQAVIICKKIYLTFNPKDSFNCCNCCFKTSVIAVVQGGKNMEVYDWP